MGELDFSDLNGPIGHSDAETGEFVIRNEDMAVKMRRRAKAGYVGSITDLMACCFTEETKWQR